MELTDTLRALFEEMNKFFRTDTVVGPPITMGDLTIVPLIDVTFGAGSGASNGSGKKEGRHDSSSSFAGGGAGGRIEPSAVIVMNNNTGVVSALSLKGKGSSGAVDSLVQLVPELIDKFKKPSA